MQGGRHRVVSKDSERAFDVNQDGILDGDELAAYEGDAVL